jgi:uncharacterized RDD family membrane protein YckC
MSIIKRCVLPIMLTLVAAPHLVQARAPANAAPGSTNAAGSTASAGAAAPAGPAGATAPSGAVATPDPAPTADHDDDDWEGSDSEHNHRSAHRHHHARHDEDDEDDDVVNLGSNSNLPSGQRADSVVSIFGSANSEGEAVDVVSVFGNTRVTGPLTDAAVSVFGSTYVDSKIDGDAVSVFGDLELGPHADVGGDAVTVFGTLHRDPGSLVHGDARNIFTSNFGDFSGLRAWAQHCLLYGRPLALAHGLGWAWGLALSFLALYALIALMFRDSLSRCVEIVETQPGQTALAGVLATLFTPLLVMLLCVTVIGIAAVPFVVTGLFCAGAFGKAVILAWLGRRVTGGHGGGPALHPAAAVLIGGAIVLVLYLVPVLGFLVFNLVALMGFGAVVYTLILATRARQAARQDGAGTTLPPGAAPAASRGTAASASAASAGGTSLAGAPPADTVAPGPAPGPGAAPATPPPAQPKAQNETQAQSPGAPSATLSASLPRAGFWVRMAALLIDALLVGVVTSVLQSHSHVNLVLLAAYGAVMWKLRGSTVGGIVFDLHVVRLDGRALDWQTAIIRALGCFLSLAVAGLGFFWIAFDDGKQAWHDKIAGTAVVRVAKGVPLV